MKPGRHKIVEAVAPGAIVDNASWTGIAIDSLGAKFLRVICYFGAMDIAMATLKLTECETSGGSYTDITGCIAGTSVNSSGSTSTLPSATADNTFFIFEVPIDGRRKRYFKVAATGGDGTNGTYMTAWAELHQLEEGPDTAAEQGAAQVLRAA